MVFDPTPNHARSLSLSLAFSFSLSLSTVNARRTKEIDPVALREHPGHVAVSAAVPTAVPAAVPAAVPTAVPATHAHMIFPYAPRRVVLVGAQEGRRQQPLRPRPLNIAQHGEVISRLQVQHQVAAQHERRHPFPRGFKSIIEVVADEVQFHKRPARVSICEAAERAARNVGPDVPGPGQVGAGAEPRDVAAGYVEHRRGTQCGEDPLNDAARVPPGAR